MFFDTVNKASFEGLLNSHFSIFPCLVLFILVDESPKSEDGYHVLVECPLEGFLSN